MVVSPISSNSGSFLLGKVSSPASIGVALFSLSLIGWAFVRRKDLVLTAKRWLPLPISREDLYKDPSLFRLPKIYQWLPEKMISYLPKGGARFFSDPSLYEELSRIEKVEEEADSNSSLPKLAFQHMLKEALEALLKTEMPNPAQMRSFQLKRTSNQLQDPVWVDRVRRELDDNLRRENPDLKEDAFVNVQIGSQIQESLKEICARHAEAISTNLAFSISREEIWGKVFPVSSSESSSESSETPPFHSRDDGVFSLSSPSSSTTSSHQRESSEESQSSLKRSWINSKGVQEVSSKYAQSVEKGGLGIEGSQLQSLYAVHKKEKTRALVLILDSLAELENQRVHDFVMANVLAFDAWIQEKGDLEFSLSLVVSAQDQRAESVREYLSGQFKSLGAHTKLRRVPSEAPALKRYSLEEIKKNEKGGYYFRVIRSAPSEMRD